MGVIEGERVALERLTLDDADFIVRLLSDPDFHRYIGDRGVRTSDDARRYLAAGPLTSYANLGFGLYRVTRKADGEPMGICGLVKRDWLGDVDLGFAFLPEYRGCGYACEAARAALIHGHGQLGFQRIVAITDPQNTASIRLLERLGMVFEGMVRASAETEPLRLYASRGGAATTQGVA
jgi:[ribosomal protein S5]-alanine N-acetyltransferase